MGWKRFFVSEPMPDKDDPKYARRRERDMAAGDRFAHAVGLTWLGKKIYVFGCAHKKLFLFLVFGIVILLFVLNTVRFVRILTAGPAAAVPVTEHVDSLLQDRYGMYNEKMSGYDGDQ